MSSRIVIVLALALAPAAALAQGGATVGTIIVAHGADSAWNAQVHAVARSVKTGGPVAVSFLMGPEAARTRFQETVASLERSGVREIVVVPLLISSYSGHYEQIRFVTGSIDTLSAQMLHHLHAAGIERAKTSTPLRLARAIDDSPDAARVLAQRALKLVAQPAEHALMMVGHGPNSPSDLAAWMSNLRRVADHVRTAAGFRDVKVALVQDDAPAPVRQEAVLRLRELIELQHQATGKPVVVVPVVISRGALTTQRLPADLNGLPIMYTPEGLLPDLGLARWVESRVQEALGKAR
ncbi:MAG: CbiX/SirB N-terminal domain-containing protein [Gemmatimonadota bacterium]